MKNKLSLLIFAGVNLVALNLFAAEVKSISGVGALNPLTAGTYISSLSKVLPLAENGPSTNFKMLINQKPGLANGLLASIVIKTKAPNARLPEYNIDVAADCYAMDVSEERVRSKVIIGETQPNKLEMIKDSFTQSTIRANCTTKGSDEATSVDVIIKYNKNEFNLFYVIGSPEDSTAKYGIINGSPKDLKLENK